MAKTVAEAFNDFRPRLEITNLQQETISTRRKSVVEKIKNGGWNVIDSFLIGSYSRHTMISPLNQADVDLMVLLDPSHYYAMKGLKEPQMALLDKVRTTLSYAFPETSKISRNGQAVTIKFSDFEVDVVPAFAVDGGGYYIPDTVTKRWIRTDPTKHDTLISRMNAYQDRDFIPLIKTIKEWNRSIGSQFNSFHMEVFALNTFQSNQVQSIRNGLWTFFQTGKAHIVDSCMDPAGYGDNLAEYIQAYQKRVEALNIFEKAWNKSVTAYQHEQNGNHRLAIEAWQTILGPRFPSYG